MNLKFWEWPGQIRELEEDYRRLVQERDDAIHQIEHTARVCVSEWVNPDKVYARTPAIVTERAQKRADVERLMTLASLAKEDPLWKAVLSYADEHERNEAQVALMPDLSDGARQYNAGRAASARDFASALRDLRLKAEKEARKE